MTKHLPKDNKHMKMVELLQKTVRQILRKRKMELPYDPAFSLLYTHPRELHEDPEEHPHNPHKFTAALFTTVREGGNRCPSMEKWVKKT